MRTSLQLRQTSPTALCHPRQATGGFAFSLVDRATVGNQRQFVDAEDRKLLQAQADASISTKGQRIQTLGSPGQPLRRRLAGQSRQTQAGIGSFAGQAATGLLPASCNLLTSQRHSLLDLEAGSPPLPQPRAMSWLRRLRRLGLGLKFAETILEAPEFGLQRLDLLARLLLYRTLPCCRYRSRSTGGMTSCCRSFALPGLEPFASRPAPGRRRQRPATALAADDGQRPVRRSVGVSFLGCHCGQL